MMRISYIVPVSKTPMDLRLRCRKSIQKIAQAEDEIIEIDNLGLCEARNEGLRCATGDWVRFVDADDEVTENFREELRECEFDVLLFGVETRWGKHGKRYVTLPRRMSGFLEIEELTKLNNNLLFRFAWNKIYRRSFLTKHKLSFECGSEPSEDAIFNLKCLIAGVRWRCIPRVGYVYWKRMHSSLFHYFPNIREALWRENALWKRIEGGDVCKWSDKRISHRVWENQWLSENNKCHPPMNWRVRHFVVWFRRVLRFIGV